LPKRDGGDLGRVLAAKAAADESVIHKLISDADIPDENRVVHPPPQDRVDRFLSRVRPASAISVSSNTQIR
jgi:hypothetical protein